MKKLLTLFSLSALAAALMAGCAATNLENEDEMAVFRKNEEFGNRMAQALQDMHPHGKILLASFVNANDLQESDGFGRITSDQVGSGLVQHGLTVVETRLRHDGDNLEIAISEDPVGEFALSRNVKKLASKHNAEFVVTGVYAYGKYNTIIAMKAIDKDGVVRKAFNYTVPATVSFDWDQHSLAKFKEHGANNGVNTFWDPYDSLDNGSGKVDLH